MAIFFVITRMDNQTEHRIEFDVDRGLCPLRALPSGKTRSVNLAKIRQLCRERRTANWRIRVLINNEFTGMYIHAYFDLLKKSQIVFKYMPDEQGLYVLCAIGIWEKRIDYLLRQGVIGKVCGRNIIWNKRTYVEFARADSRWTRNLREPEAPSFVALLVGGENIILPTRESQGPNTVAPLITDETSVPLREFEDRSFAEPLTIDESTKLPVSLSEEPNIVVPLIEDGTGLLLRQAGFLVGRRKWSRSTSALQRFRRWSTIFARVSSKIGRPNFPTNAARRPIRANGHERDQGRFYRVPRLHKLMDKSSTHLLLFVLALTLVGLAQGFYPSLWLALRKAFIPLS